MELRAAERPVQGRRAVFLPQELRLAKSKRPLRGGLAEGKASAAAGSEPAFARRDGGVNGLER